MQVKFAFVLSGAPVVWLSSCAMMVHRLYSDRKFKMTKLGDPRMLMAMCPPGGGRPALSV